MKNSWGRRLIQSGTMCALGFLSLELSAAPLSLLDDSEGQGALEEEFIIEDQRAVFGATDIETEVRNKMWDYSKVCDVNQSNSLDSEAEVSCTFDRLKVWDKNGNSSFEAVEIAEFVKTELNIRLFAKAVAAELLKKFDTDKDVKLSDAETRYMLSDMKKP